MIHSRSSLMVAAFTMVLAAPQVSNAAYLTANNCRIGTIVEAFYYDGNTGNYNLGNVEHVYFELIDCDTATSTGGSSSFGVSMYRNYPEFGTVTNPIPDQAYPEEVVKRWLDTFRDAKLAKKRVNVTGDGSGTFVDHPIYLAVK